MPRSSLAYEKPSPLSRWLVTGFSVAVVAMAGWFAMTVMFFPRANTMVADDQDIDTASMPPYVENVPPEPARLSAMEQFDSAFSEPSPRAYAPYSAAPPAPPRSALALASPAEPPPAGALDSPFAASSMPAANDRGILADEPPRQTASADAVPDVIPLPPPKPARSAAIPVPRPRPHLDGEDTQPGPERSIFDIMIDRQR